MGKLYLGTQEISPFIYDTPMTYPRIVRSNGRYDYPADITIWKFPDDATKLGYYCFAYGLVGCNTLTTVDFNNITDSASAGGLQSAFSQCPNLSTILANKLRTVNHNSVFSSAFHQCTSLTTVTFPVLEEITGQSTFYRAFRGCSNLTTLSFPALNSVGNSYTNQFSGMLMDCSNVTVHFPAAMQSVIGSWADVTNGFGGTNTTVLFDL